MEFLSHLRSVDVCPHSYLGASIGFDFHVVVPKAREPPLSQSEASGKVSRIADQ